ncbi:hypothetical protein BVX99_01535 [bacterium F16]|nr:hypothetical protein BVX99_01535 [bacterium F16]
MKFPNRIKISINDTKGNPVVNPHIYLMDNDYKKVLPSELGAGTISQDAGKYHVLLYANGYKLAKSFFEVEDKKGLQKIVLKMEKAPSIKVNVTGEAMKGTWRLKLRMMYNNYPFIRVRVPKWKYMNGAAEGSLSVDIREPFVFLVNDDFRKDHTNLLFTGCIYKHSGDKEISQIDIEIPQVIDYEGEVGSALAGSKMAFMIFTTKMEEHKKKAIAYGSFYKDDKFRAKLAAGTTYYRYLRVRKGDGQDYFYKLAPYSVPKHQKGSLKEQVEILPKMLIMPHEVEVWGM